MIPSTEFKDCYYSRSGESTNPKQTAKWWDCFRMYAGPSRWAKIARSEIGRRLREGQVWELRKQDSPRVLAWFVLIDGVMFCKDVVGSRRGSDALGKKYSVTSILQTPFFQKRRKK